MSQQYDGYLYEHISNVTKAWWWMEGRGIIPPHMAYEGLRLADHDNSKYDEEEYGAYDDYFYGKEGKDEDDVSVIDSAFDYAWLHHIHRNPHHWQYWVLINDDDGTKALEMPESAVYEMIADWWSFSWKENDLKIIFDWYEKHKGKMILHEKTRKLVESVLAKIQDILNKEETGAPAPIQEGDHNG